MTADLAATAPAVPKAALAVTPAPARDAEYVNTIFSRALDIDSS